VAEVYESLETCPDDLLLFMHHVPYTHVLSNGKTVIQHFYDEHYDGAEDAKWLARQWESLRGLIDEQRFEEVLERQLYQAEHADVWRDSICRWFFEKSQIPDDDGRVEVEMLPTFSGCPATDLIGDDVAEAVRGVPGVTEVTVSFRFDPPWTPERIDAEGREQLREFGITPPGEVVRSPALDGAEDRPALPLLRPQRPCPYCGSSETETDSAFGPTPCRSIHFCRACQQPFEAFKDL
jgi:ring-1,2-phenylacetyl-CoA epoxidase subunit PaaD